MCVVSLKVKSESLISGKDKKNTNYHYYYY